MKNPAVLLMVAIAIIALVASASNGALDGIFGGGDQIIIIVATPTPTP